MIIKVDYRDNELFNELCKINSKNLIINKENLPVGDVIICDNDNNEKIIIERKTLNDLAGSIRDGRYNEQSFRLVECELHNHNIYYLIEGELEKYNSRYNNIEKKSLISAMISLGYSKGFSIYKSNNIFESSEWIYCLASKIEDKNLVSFYDYQDNSKTNYSSLIKRVKKDNITVDNIGEIMLSQIPNVSVNVASIVLEKFKNISNLIISLKSDDKLLDNLYIVSKDNKKRKISKTAITNIKNYLIV